MLSFSTYASANECPHDYDTSSQRTSHLRAFGDCVTRTTRTNFVDIGNHVKVTHWTPLRLTESVPSGLAWECSLSRLRQPLRSDRMTGKPCLIEGGTPGLLGTASQERREPTLST